MRFLKAKFEPNAGLWKTCLFPKTRKKGPRRQHVVVSDPLLVRCLQRVCQHLDASSCLLPYTEHTARKRVQQVCQALGLPHNLYAWSSLRAGGASFEYLNGMPLSALKFRGRWSAERSLDHFVQECVTFLDMAGLSLDTKQRIQRVARCSQALLMEYAHNL